MHTRRLHALRTGLLAAALAAYAVSAAAQSAPTPPALFEPLAGIPALQARGDAAARRPPPRRARRVRARLDALAANAAQPGQRLLLNLFDDESVVARGTEVERDGARTIWHGRLESEPDGQVTLVATDGVLAGTVFARGRTFEIAYEGDGSHEIRELDPAAFPTDDPPLATPQAPADAAGAAADASPQVDVMVVWTPAARTAAGGTAAMQNLVALAVANANTAYANSQIASRLRLVYSGEVSYTEAPGDILGDLSKLAAAGDGVLDGVHTLRDQYGADVVSLLGTGYTSGSGACGIGYLMSTVTTSFASLAFNVVDQACAAGNLSLAHEIGHNEGLHHDPANADGQGAYAYAYGYQDPGGLFRTVMSYGSATRIMYFSNPSVTYSGRPTGVANAQDNARALNNTAATAASFRQPAAQTCSFSVSPTSLSYSTSGGSRNVTITTASGCAWSVDTGAGWLASSAASGSGSATISITAASNTSLSARAGTMSVAGKTISVTQAALTCSYAVSPTSLTFVAGGSSASVTVTTSSGCGWTTAALPSWMTATPTSQTGSGVVTLTAEANAGLARGASLTVAGTDVLVSQAAAPAAPVPSAPRNLRVVQ